MCSPQANSGTPCPWRQVRPLAQEGHPALELEQVRPVLGVGPGVDALPGSTGQSLPPWPSSLLGRHLMCFISRSWWPWAQGPALPCPAPSTWTQPPLGRTCSWLCPGPRWLRSLSPDRAPFSGLVGSRSRPGLPPGGQCVTDTAQVKARPCCRPGNCSLWLVSPPPPPPAHVEPRPLPVWSGAPQGVAADGGGGAGPWRRRTLAGGLGGVCGDQWGLDRSSRLCLSRSM